MTSLILYSIRQEADNSMKETMPKIGVPQARTEIRNLSMLRGGKDKAFTVTLDPFPHLVLDQGAVLQGWYKSKHESSPNKRPRPCYTEHLLTKPYGGFCPGNCVFCYVQWGTRGYRRTGLPTVDPAYPEKVEKMLSKLHVAFPAYISSFTEPFHALEPTYHVTERLAKVFDKVELPILFCTRQIMPDWAKSILTHNKYSYAQFSINTSDPKDIRIMCPRGASYKDLMREIHTLSKMGVYTSIQCNPIIPGISNWDEVAQVAIDASKRGLQHIIFKFCESLTADNAKWFIEKLGKRFPKERVDLFKRVYTQRIGGVLTVSEAIRRKFFDRMMGLTKDLGITMSLCYEYTTQGPCKAGNSMLPEYTTADQCHGRAIPVFYRENLEDTFKPFPGCYGACLYCKEKGTQACHNDTLLEAKALRYPDIRKLHLNVGGE